MEQSTPAGGIEAASPVLDTAFAHWRSLEAACLVVTEYSLKIAGTRCCRNPLCRKLVLQQCSKQDRVRLVLPQLEHLEVTLCKNLHALRLECPQLVTCTISECSSLWQVGSAFHLFNAPDGAQAGVLERCVAVCSCSMPARACLQKQWRRRHVWFECGMTVLTHRPPSTLGLRACSCC